MTACQPREVHIQQLVSVQCKARTRLCERLGGEPEAAAPAERLRLLDRHDLDPEPGELPLETRSLTLRAADHDPLDPRCRQECDLVGREGMACNGHEGLRTPVGSLPEALGFSSGEEDRLHD